MNILVIKQTSLGDVLHSTGHIRAIKEQFPNSHLSVLSADTSAEIYQNNPHIDELILFKRYEVKERWLSNPLWTFDHFKTVIRQVNARRYDLAIDLQGRWKSVLFLYLCHASNKYVKGRWPGLYKFRDRSMHALAEMDNVLKLAKISTNDTSMEFYSAQGVSDSVGKKLVELGYNGNPIVLISPFTRWPSKNWSLKHYADLITLLPENLTPVITGAKGDVDQVESLVHSCHHKSLINCCGKLGLQEFAEVMRKARVVISGDSFAMHLAVACGTPVVALFGPTDESKVGPTSPNDRVLRNNEVDCNRCYKRNCERQCINSISPQKVCSEVMNILATPVMSGK